MSSAARKLKRQRERAQRPKKRPVRLSRGERLTLTAGNGRARVPDSLLDGHPKR